MGTILIPWGSGGWRGKQVLTGAEPGFELPGFDDSSWPEIALPIGGGQPTRNNRTTFCPIHYEHPPATSWSEATDFLLRRTIIGTDFTLRFAVDNEATIYFDGTSVGTFTNLDPGTGDACPERDDHDPRSGSLGGGAHLLAIRARDWDGECYFDCELALSQGGFSVGQVRLG